jgi:7-cyano-7-deazaguanine synthase
MTNSKASNYCSSKSILILSGGMDSTTLLYWLVKKKQEVRCLSFYYGQKHKKEIQYADDNCKKLKVAWSLIDISALLPLISNSSLTSEQPVPEGHYEEESMKATVVPNRNMIMLSIAAAYAENLKYDSVMYAAHKGDHAIYPDCRGEFMTALDLACQLGTYNKIRLIAPFREMHKGEIAKLGLSLGIDFDHDTWSCYNGNDEPCQKCGTCVERKEALEFARNKS